MGVFNFVKQGARQLFVARPDDKKHLIVYKHPDQNIPLGNRVTIDQDECAVFFKNGVVMGVLGPGQAPIDAQNIPFLAPLINSFTGGNALIAELFFVKTMPVRGITFGGPAGDIVDPSTGFQVPIRIFGEFAVQVVDPARFVIGYVGQAAAAQDNDTVLKWVRDRFLNSVTTVLTELCELEEKSVRLVVNNKERLAQAFMQRTPNLNEIGIRIVEMGKLEPNIPEEYMQQLRAAEKELADARRDVKKKQIAVEGARAQAEARQFELDQQFNQEFRNVQGLAGGNLQNFAAARMMMGAGQGMAEHGPGGGIAALGAQMAMGVGMAGAMQQGFAGAQNPVGPAVVPQGVPLGTGAMPGAPPGVGAPGGTTSASEVACGACNHRQPPGKFCRECGTALAPVKRFCTSCGTDVPPNAKFCHACGASQQVAAQANP
jgi:membrane protease subunit (stomatin/prohibitin family)